MKPIDIKKLFFSCVHYGHKKYLCHPNMKKFIFKVVNNISIINLNKTADAINYVSQNLKLFLNENKKILFICTKKKISDFLKNNKLIINNYYILNKWIGGLLTNWGCIKKIIQTYKDLKLLFDNKTFLNKNNINKKKKFDKLKLLLEGIENMEQIPEAIFIFDEQKEQNAIKEAKMLGIKIFGIIDTNCNPENINYFIPGNDDSIKSIQCILNMLNDNLQEK